MPMNDRDLLNIEADTNFTYDERGRILLSNEPLVSERHPAQRFYLGRTGNGHVARFGVALPDDVVAQLTEIVARERLDSDLRAPPTMQAAIQEALARHAPPGDGGSGPAYRFPDTIVQTGNVVRVTAETRDLVRDTFP